MKHLLLLHGAIGAKDQLMPLAQWLSEKFTVHALNFSGHGGEPSKGEFSIAGFAQDVIEFLDKQNIGKVSLFGYSMGGYVALYLAAYFPERVEKVVTLATKFRWTEEIANREIKMLDPDKISEKVPAFAKQLEMRHAPENWKDVLIQTRRMMLNLGADNPLQTTTMEIIQHPVLIGLGDRDTMVTLEETIEIYRCLPNGSLIVFPNGQHPIEKFDVKKLSAEISEFLERS